MTHKELLSANSNENSECDGEVEIYKTNVFYDDVSWDIYQCKACGAKIATCQADWWNHTVDRELPGSED